MKLVAALFASAAVVSASPELTSSGDNLEVRLPRQGDLRVERQLTVDVGAILAEIQSTQIPAVAASAAVDAREAAFDATLTAMRDVSSQINNVNTQILSLAASVDSRLSSFQASYDRDMAAAQSRADDQMSAAAAQLASGMAATNSALEAQAGLVDLQISRTVEQLTGVVNATTSTTLSAVAAKRDGRTYMWSGGCSSHGGGGWQEYCLNRVQVNLSMPKFQVNPSNNRRFIARQPGYYHINYWVASRYCSWAYHCIYVAGRRRTHGYYRQGYHEGGNSWRDLHQDLTWPVRTGQDFYGRTYAGCWYAYHSNNDNGEHSRMTVVWQGDWDQQGI